MIKDLVKKKLNGFTPYKVNTDKANIILDANESSFDLSENVKKRVISMIEAKTGLNRYPDTYSTMLGQSIAEKYGCLPENIVVGTGSDQIITVLINTFIDPGDVVISPTPSFDMYKVSSIIGSAEVKEFELRPEKDYRYDTDEIIGLIRKYSPKLVFLCSPNNPTGNSLSNSELDRIIRAAEKSIVVVDEAYVEFSDRSFTDVVLKYDNAIVLRTFSKAYGLAGIRCGFSISNKDITEQLLKVLPPYNISRFSQDVARYVLEDDEENKRRIEFLKSERDRIITKLKKLDGLKIFRSNSNFYLLKVMNGRDLYCELLNRGIRIRKYDRKKLLKDCFRINVGSKEENDEVIKSITEVFK